MRTVQARHFNAGRIARIRAIVLHDMEAPEGPLTAENVARYFATTDREASAHVCVDNDSAVRCVSDDDTAFAAPGCNADGLQLEIAGYMRQTREQWLDAYSRAALHQAAIIIAAWCTQYGIPAVRLTRAELKAGKPGITCHADVSAVYKRSDHTDPGPDFPWDVVLADVKTLLGATQPAAAAPTAAPAWPGRYLRLGVTGDDVRTWQRQMRTRGWSIAVDGTFSAPDDTACRAFQAEKGLTVDGVVGPATWKAAWKAPIT